MAPQSLARTPLIVILAALVVGAMTFGNAPPARAESPAECTADATETVRAGRADVPAAACIEGVLVPQRGGHLLTYWSFHVYSVALYAPEDARTTDALLAADTPKRLELHYHRRISASDIVKAMRAAIKDREGLDLEALDERLKRAEECFVTVNSGDTYVVDYSPATETTTIRFTGGETCTFEGADFADAFFGIWISDQPLDRRMAEALRGF